MRKVGRPMAIPNRPVNRPATGSAINSGTPCDSRIAFSVGADAKECGVAETDQAGVAGQQHHAHAGDREDEHATKFADVELAEHERDHEQHDAKEAVPEQVAAMAP